MIAALRSELLKLRRRRVLIVTAVTTLIFSIGSAAIVLASASQTANPAERGLTFAELADAGGGTEVFTTAVSFAGTFLFVVFVGAVVLAAAEVITWVAARLFAPSQDVATGEWFSAAALGDALTDYALVLYWVTGYALLGMMVAVLVRSVPLALGIGIAWAGPIEHIVQDAWSTSARIFPGLLLEEFVAGGTSEVSASRAFLIVTAYVLVATTIAATSFARRDVTG
jgi:hypothetical protein